MAETKAKNIFQKLACIKLAIASEQMSKSGKNEYSKYNYVQLTDIMPVILRECGKEGVCTHITFTPDDARLTVYNSDNPEERLEYTSPMTAIQMKGANEIQAIGAVQTYQRRYLYLMAFDIAVPDEIDCRGNNQPRQIPQAEPSSAEQQMLIEPLDAELKKRYCDYYKVQSISKLNYAQAEAIIKKRNLREGNTE